MRFRLATVVLAAGALFLSACATVGAVEDDDREEDLLPTPVEVPLSEVEVFDIAPYREHEPVAEQIEHEVPDVLMDGRIRTEGVRTAPGFRIQISSTVEKDEAVIAEEAAQQWWRSDDRGAIAGLSGDELPVYVVYRQPYYRVRIGNFATRAEADRAASVVQSRFPGSFIVPDTVTLSGGN